ncbi:MAG TPA: F0F1 ATP synthase subunit A [Balneolaceae bacterium]|nr:F0F1 ATP synthase subunit A [Balneolaceae bacterium]
MVKAFRRLLVLLCFCLFLPLRLAAAGKKGDQANNNPIQVVSVVKNHNKFEYPGGWVPLPRILLANGHWYFFKSTTQAIKSGKFTEKNGELVPANGGDIDLDLSITSHLIYFWISMLISLGIVLGMVRRYRKGYGRTTEPKGWFQNMFESVFIFIREEVAEKNLRPELARKYFPFLFGIFILILFMNLFSLVPWGETATADITVTATLAVVSFVLTQRNSTKSHWREIFWYPGVPIWVRFLLIPGELIGVFTKPFALAVRLYANMLSGKIMIVCILGLIFVFAQSFGRGAGWATSVVAVPVTVSLFALKAIISLIQAYIFSLLTAVFIGLADKDHAPADQAAEVHA